LYEEQQYRLVGRRTQRVFRMGDAIRVGVIKVDKVRNEIDLSALTDESHSGAGSRNPVGRKKKKKRYR
jgi:DNA-directed RNA polymerase subunit E'/Rpb7